MKDVLYNSNGLILSLVNQVYLSRYIIPHIQMEPASSIRVSGPKALQPWGLKLDLDRCVSPLQVLTLEGGLVWWTFLENSFPNFTTSNGKYLPDYML